MSNNQAWLGGRIDDLEPMIHPFRDFSDNARIHEFREHDHQVDVVGEVTVVTFRYDMVYERSGARYRSAGRDLWIFQKQDRTWIALWRTMFDMEEKAA